MEVVACEVEPISEKLFIFCPMPREFLGCGDRSPPTTDLKALSVFVLFKPGDVSLFARCEVIVEKVFVRDSTSDPHPIAEFRYDVYWLVFES
jgi:hypothetical protein